MLPSSLTLDAQDLDVLYMLNLESLTDYIEHNLFIIIFV